MTGKEFADVVFKILEDERESIISAAYIHRHDQDQVEYSGAQIRLLDLLRSKFNIALQESEKEDY